MIRAFDWRDVGLVRRLAEQGVCLDAETCYTRGWRSLQSALLGYLAPAVATQTFVWQGDGGAAIAQMEHRANDDRARLLFLAPALAATTGPAWEELIERLAAEAGERGAHNLIAHVDQDGAVFEALRRMGFAIYARQAVWRLTGPPTQAANGDLPGLRSQVSADSWGIQVLYSNVAPRLVQQVEAPPKAHGRGYVLEEDGEIVAYLYVARGPLGVWCEPFLHPQAYGRSAEVIASFVRLTGDGSERPVYFCVKSYQEWLDAPLAEAGFEPASEQAVMVKRMAVRLAEMEPLPVAVLDQTGSRAEVTSPLVKTTRPGG